MRPAARIPATIELLEAPEAAPGPHDATYFFDHFADLIEKER